MEFLVVSRRLTEQYADADFRVHTEAEVEQARALYSQGVIRHIWRRGDQVGACLLLEADSEVQARASLATLPLHREGMVEVTVIPLMPYTGFCPSGFEVSGL